MADQQSKGGLGRLFARAQQRRRERKQREEERSRHHAAPGRIGDERAYRTLQERRALDEDRARIEERQRREAAQRFTYRETGGGYGGYGGTADRGAYRPEQGRFTAGYSGYGGAGGREDMGARRPWEAGGSWERGGTMVVRRGGFPSGGETWRGGEFRGGTEHWRGAEFRGGGAETWRNRERMRPGAGRRMEHGAWAAHPENHPRGLGEAYDEDMIPAMERGWHPEHPGGGMVEPLGAGTGGYGGMHYGGGAFRESRGEGGFREGRPFGEGRSRTDWEEQELGARRVGPGAFRRGRYAGGGAAMEGGHRGSNWEGGSDAERTGAWFGGEDRVRTGWTGSGPSSEHTGEWIGGDVSSNRESPAWYGGGVREAAEDRPAQSFGSLGGPNQGRYGREPPGDRGGGRGFGGPLGRFQDRHRGEQGRLFDGRYRGREDEFPVYGEAVAGRGHVGSDDYRDLTRFGQGRGDPGSAERYRERHEEGDHFRGR